MFLAKKDRYAALLLLGMTLSTTFNGYDAGIITVILADPQFNDYYQINDTRRGIVATIPWATTIVAQAFVGSALSSSLGRLWALRLSIAFMCIGVVVESVPNTFAVLVLGRLMTGLAFGSIFIAANLYTTECSPKHLRGAFVGTMVQFGYQLGTLLAFWTGYGMSAYDSPTNIAWRVSNLVQLPLGILLLALLCFYPESPRWLLDHRSGSPEKALKALARIRSATPTDECVRQEFHEMVAAHQYRKQLQRGYSALVKRPGLRRRVVFGWYMTALQQIGGIAVLTIYAALIYESLGWTAPRQALIINGVQSVLQLFIVLVNTFAVDRYGRRKLLLTGLSIETLALLIFCCLVTVFKDSYNTTAAVVEVAMLFIVGLTYCWSNGPITITVASEIFPQHVREKAYGISLLGQSFCILALTQSWPSLNAKIGSQSYWLLFGLSTAATISVYFLLPETYGISLERMDAVFGEVDMVQAGEARQSETHDELEKRALSVVVTALDAEACRNRVID